MDQRLPVNILLVEDSATDIVLAKAVSKSVESVTLWHIARDGVEAMELLTSPSSSAQSDRPDLVLLDINMPRKDGFEVLREIMADSSLCAIPVIMCTTSSDESDIERAFELGATAYVVKPQPIDEFEAIFVALGQLVITGNVPPELRVAI